MRSETYYKKLICAIIFFALFSISTFAVFAAAIGYIIDNTMINPNLPAEEKDKLFALLYQPVQAKVTFIFIIPAILGLIIIFRSFKLWAKLNHNGEPSPHDLKWLFSFTIVLGFYSFFILFTSLINHQTDMAGATAIITSSASEPEILAKPGFNFLEWTTKLEIYDILLWICLGTYLILLVPISMELATLKKLPNVPKEPTLATAEEVNLASDNSRQPAKISDQELDLLERIYNTLNSVKHTAWVGKSNNYLYIDFAENAGGVQDIIKGLIIKYGAHTAVDDENPHLLIVENKSKMLRDALVHYKKKKKNNHQ